MTSLNIKSLYIFIIIAVLSLSGCSDNNNTPVVAPEQTTAEETTIETTNSLLPEGIAYIFEDGTSVSIDDILSPVTSYNQLSTTGDSSWFANIYPSDVLTFTIETSPYETPEEYALYMNTLYTNAYGDTFVLNNEFISCQLLSEDMLISLKDFYLENINAEISPEYGFIVESIFTINYTDEAGEEKSDQEPDFYITYFQDGTLYLDYFFLDTLDL